MGDICASPGNQNNKNKINPMNPYNENYASPGINWQIAPPSDNNFNTYNRYGSNIKLSQSLKIDQGQTNPPKNPEEKNITPVTSVPKPVVNDQNPNSIVNSGPPKQVNYPQSNNFVQNSVTPKIIVNPQSAINNGMNIMTNNANKLNEQNVNINKGMMANNQANANIQLENQSKNYNINIEQFTKEKNDYIQKINKISNENMLLKNNLSQKEKENQILQKKYEEIVPITVGLNNIGATCYMNATLQSLSNVKELSHYFLNKFTPNDAKKKLSNEYNTVVRNLWDRKNNGKAFSPDSFKNTLSQMNPLFAGIAANDSKDLINFILETLHNELNKPTGKINNYMITPNDQKDEIKMFNIFREEMKSNFKSPISDLFYGVLETRTNCLNCQSIKYNFQIYSFIEFPLQQVYNYCLKNYPGNNYISQGIPVVDLYRCFEFYQLPTLMTGNNQIYCNDCKRSFDAYYGTLLYFLPNYLIINLNRGKNAVFQCNVKFPELLKLHKYVINQERNTVFKLVSVISHYGPSSMGGHFIAYCRHYQDNCWYNYNDSTVTKCTNPKPYLTGMPYILFYKTLDDE